MAILRTSLVAILSLGLVWLEFSTPANAQVAGERDDTLLPADLHLLSISDLINIEVYSAAKRPQKVADTAAAIYVITQEDIRRSGATTIPEILRMVPGLTVAKIDGSQWAITARGFNAVFGDKLLVLIDGRSVYTPFFGGVFWDVQDTLLADIERIEVIRGPGSTLWGANATNGVINIITKSASQTHGALVHAGGGTYENGFGGARYGDKVGPTDYRVYTKYFNRGPSELETGAKANDRWEGARAGFRTDTELSEKDLLTIQGDGYYNESEIDLIRRTLTGTVRGEPANRYHHGFNLLGRWNHEISESSNTMLQTYFDHINRDDFVLEQRRSTFDVEGQHRFSPMERHDVIYGVGYRFYQDSIDNSFAVSVDPESRNINLYTGFIQDQITLVEEQWYLIGGVKLEQNAHSGFEIMPSARVLFTPQPTKTFWAAVSRAVRSPARFNEDGRLLLDSFVDPETGLTTVVSGLGDRSYQGENVIAYEAGFRVQPEDWISLDVASFYNNYTDLESFEPRDPTLVVDREGRAFIEVPFVIDNKLKGETYGVEVTLDIRPYSFWRLVTSYAHLTMNLRRTKGSLDQVFIRGAEQTPQSQWYIRSLMSLRHDLELDAAFRAVSEVGAFDISAYEELDLRLAWRPVKNLELAVVGKNLLDSRHMEFASNLVDVERTAVKRGVFGEATWSY